ncbi:trimethylamine methyltransferase family protein [Desulfosporosinus fructosivorans]
MNAEELALDVIKEVGPGGHYLTNMHTLRNFKKVWYLSLFSRDMQNSTNLKLRGKLMKRLNQ